MMARKLSALTRHLSYVLVAGAALLTANNLWAQAADPPTFVDNPYANAKSQPKPAAEAAVPVPVPVQPRSTPQQQAVAEPAQKSHRRQIAYQNPFTATSKSPPADTSLRPGPISRWRHPVIPGENASAIKSAMLSPPAGEPANRTWDQLPPAEDLRNRIGGRNPESDPAFYARLTTPPSAIQFTPKALTQPAWLTEFDDEMARGVNPMQVEGTVFDNPPGATDFANQTSAQATGKRTERSEKVSRAFAIDEIDASPVSANSSPTVIASDIESSSADSFDQAQHLSKDANTLDELSTIAELCDRGLRSNPDQKLSASLRRLSAWAYNRHGELLADANHADDALENFQTAISLDPSCSLAIHNRAVTFAQQNQFDAALRDFNRVIDLNPGLAVAYRNRAELLAALGRLKEAISDYNQAINNLPNDAQLYRGRAYAYQQVGEYSKSAIDFDRSIEINPADPDTITQRGNLAAEQGNYDEAVADFQQAFSKDPNWAEAYRSLAWLQATCPNASYQNPTDAIAAAERAAKLAPPNDYLILDTLSAAHAAAGHFDKATDLQQQAIACAPPEIAPVLRDRLSLYLNGQAFRNVASASSTQPRELDESAVEANLPVGALR